MGPAAFLLAALLMAGSGGAAPNRDPAYDRGYRSALSCLPCHEKGYRK